jgi:hypothetical protein
MHRLHRILAFAVVISLLGGLGLAWDASARQNKQQTRPSQRPPAIVRDRWMYGPPLPPSSERNYYGPAPGVQGPMQRVPLPAPLAQPPTNR